MTGSVSFTSYRRGPILSNATAGRVKWRQFRCQLNLIVDLDDDGEELVSGRLLQHLLHVLLLLLHHLLLLSLLSRLGAEQAQFS
jgi:hypothetical protein